MLAHAPVGETLARRTAIVKMLHNVLDGTAKVLLLIGNMSVSSQRVCATIPHSGRRSLERVTVGKRAPGEHRFNLRFSF